MLKFKVRRNGVVLEYEPETVEGGWIWARLKQTKGSGVRLSHVFRFLRTDLLEEPTADAFEDIGGFTYRFRLASAEAGYFRIAGRKLAIDNDVLIAKEGVEWSRKLFAAERNVSIFLRIGKLVAPRQEIVVGGKRHGAIPAERFAEMLKKFPGTREMDRYANARVANIVGEYIDPLRDFRGQYETYLSRRKSVTRDEPLRAEELIDTEIAKFELIHDTIRAWLMTGDKSEEQWQKKLLAFLPLIFPKYVAVLEKLPVEDRYTNPPKVITRQIDMALVDVNGNIDVIEIKKPADDILLRKTLYRDNFVPTGDLSGTIMQAEKYLFHLAKGGMAAEDKLTVKYQSLLPPGLTIRITNPKALLILGRDRKPDGSSALTNAQLADLEVIKRKYANMIDIITYDDLLRRLRNIIASLQRRAQHGLDANSA